MTGCSSGVVAELSAQKSSSSLPAAAGSPSSRADQGEQGADRPAGGAAQADDLDPGQLLGAEQALSTPAVKAVWLPPPWQAIATLVRPVSVIRSTVAGSACLLRRPRR